MFNLGSVSKKKFQNVQGVKVLKRSRKHRGIGHWVIKAKKFQIPYFCIFVWTIVLKHTKGDLREDFRNTVKT